MAKKSETKDRSYISNISLYEDDFVKEFELKHNTYPYRIHYCVQYTTNKFLEIYSLNYRNRKTPVNSGKIIVETLKDKAIKYRQKGIDSPEITEINNQIQYIWNYSYYPSVSNETNADYKSEDIPELKILPLNFKYGKVGSNENWETFGNWIFNLNKDKDILPTPEKEKINNLLAGIDNDKAKAEKLYKYMQQNTRYINVKIDVGGMQAYPASYVCENRYGDCKTLSNYYQALLKHAGIESHYTLISSGYRIKEFYSDFASQQFNHAIITIPFPGDTTFVECTSKNLPFGYVHSSIQGRKALIIEENNSRLIWVPQMTHTDVLCERGIQVSGNNVNITTIYRGKKFEESNYLLNNITKNDAEMHLRNTIFRHGSYSLLEYDFKATDNNTSLIFEGKVNYHNAMKYYGNNLSLISFPYEIPNYETPEKRKTGVVLYTPTFNTDKILYKIEDKQIKMLPQDIKIDNQFGHYYLSFSMEENTFIVEKSLLIKEGRYTLEEYPDFYLFMQTIKALENQNIYLEVL